jgi:hypothetical protein
MNTIKKKRGGQPNNKNAFQHGFYSSTFKARESRLLNEAPLTDLNPEIELVRVMTIRYLQSKEADPQLQDFEKPLSVLRAVALSALAISSLVRQQRARALVDKEVNEWWDQLERNISKKPGDEVKDVDPAS